jgi:hypothetical protein
VTVADIVPFPLARRRAFIDRHARFIAAMSPDAGERYLDRQLRIQFENLQRRGIAPRIIDREVIALDAATGTHIATKDFMSWTPPSPIRSPTRETQNPFHSPTRGTHSPTREPHVAVRRDRVAR